MKGSPRIQLPPTNLPTYAEHIELRVTARADVYSSATLALLRIERGVPTRQHLWRGTIEPPLPLDPGHADIVRVLEQALEKVRHR